MNEIRFSPPTPPPSPTQTHLDRDLPENKIQNKKSFVLKKVFRIFKFFVLILIVAAVLAAGFFFVKDKIFNKGYIAEKGASPYSAVFLSNGQVYFGKIIKKNNSEIVLSNVYYLQLSENGRNVQVQDQTSETKFSLIKLGNEIHGPTDKLYINISQVLFYESLREDSTVAQSIKAQN